MKRFKRICGLIAGLSFTVMTFGCETLPIWTLAVLLVIFGAAMYFGGFMYGIFYPATYGRHYRRAKRRTASAAGTTEAVKANV